MKKYILLIIFSAFCLSTIAQEEETEKVKDKPVRSPWESGMLIDNQTSYIPVEKTLEMVIQHKFGPMSNGLEDMLGIYAPGAHMRLGLNYVVYNNVQLGLGATKTDVFQYTDLNGKWTILEQTRQNTVPVALTFYGNIGIDIRDVGYFGTGEVVEGKGDQSPEEIGFTDRLSYFSQLIVGRKFTDWLSLQAAVSYTHYNTVEWDYDRRNVGIHINGRIKVTPQGSIIFNYDHPLQIDGLSEQPTWDNHPEPNVAFGYEISTSTHAFQLYMGSANGILPQDVMMFNSRELSFDNFAIGFVITRLWNF